MTRRHWLDGVSLLSLIAAVMLIFATGIFGARGLNETRPVLAGLFHTPTPTPTPSPTPTLTPTATQTPTPTPTPTATPEPLLVAIVAGHRNNDSGAVCEGGPYNGLQEVQVTTAVTAELKKLLEERGYRVVDLDEFDARLNGLQAAALVSIHVDSCVDWGGTTGFKVARSAVSAIPEAEDRFVACMEREYGSTTGLPVHRDSITHNMTMYHAFRKVDPATPALIIELGFLFHDHDLLTQQQPGLAQGLALGIGCFLNGRQ